MSRKFLSVFFGMLLLVGFSCGRKKKQDISKAQQKRVKRAKKLMAEAGYEDPEKFPEVTVLYNTSKLHEKVAVAIQDMWKRHLGINVTLRNTEWKTYLEKMDNLDYKIARRGWIADYKDPFTFLEMFRTGGGNNDTGWGSKKYDQLLGKIKSTKDPEKRQEFMEQAERILMKDVPIVPVYYYVTKELVNEKVKGWYQNSRGLHPLRSVYRTDDKPVVIHLSGEIKSVDPGIVSGVPEHRVQNGLYEGLLRFDPKTLETEPGVAKSYDVSEDGKTYTFHLRDCKWSDGKPVTAQDFEKSWKRVLNPETGAEYAHIMYFLKGAEKYNTGKADADILGVEAKDQNTLVVTLKHPTPFFPKLTAFFTYYPVRTDLIEKYGKDWVKPKNHVGNGAYTLEERVINSHITLKKNKQYWRSDKVKQETIKFRPIQKVSTAYNLYKKGKIHVMTTVPPNKIEQIKSRDDFYSQTYLGSYFYSFNTTEPPFDDPKVRKALGLAINREVIVEKITKAGEKPAYHFVPPVFEGFQHTRFDKTKINQ